MPTIAACLATASIKQLSNELRVMQVSLKKSNGQVMVSKLKHLVQQVITWDSAEALMKAMNDKHRQPDGKVPRRGHLRKRYLKDKESVEPQVVSAKNSVLLHMKDSNGKDFKARCRGGGPEAH